MDVGNLVNCHLLYEACLLSRPLWEKAMIIGES